MFEVKVRRKFRASHALANYDGGHEEPHAHDFTLEVVVESESLDESGCAVDFRVVDEVLSEVLSTLEGSAIHESKDFLNISSSAENIAVHIFNTTSKKLDVRVAKVTVWEDADHGATYFR